MSRVAIWAQLEAKPGKEKEVEEFLKSAQPLAEREPGTLSWYAIKMGPSTYGIFDTFADENGTQRPPERRNCQSALRQSQRPFFQTARYSQAGGSRSEIGEGVTRSSAKQPLSQARSSEHVNFSDRLLRNKIPKISGLYRNAAQESSFYSRANAATAGGANGHGFIYRASPNR